MVRRGYGRTVGLSWPVKEQPPETFEARSGKGEMGGGEGNGKDLEKTYIDTGREAEEYKQGSSSQLPSYRAEINHWTQQESTRNASSGKLGEVLLGEDRLRRSQGREASDVKSCGK